MITTKHLLASKTVWGAAIAALPVLVPALPELLPAIGVDAATASRVITVAGTALAIYGRATATGGLHVRKPRQ